MFLIFCVPGFFFHSKDHHSRKKRCFKFCFLASSQPVRDFLFRIWFRSQLSHLLLLSLTLYIVKWFFSSKRPIWSELSPRKRKKFVFITLLYFCFPIKVSFSLPLSRFSKSSFLFFLITNQDFFYIRSWFASDVEKGSNQGRKKYPK